MKMAAKTKTGSPLFIHKGVKALITRVVRCGARGQGTAGDDSAERAEQWLKMATTTKTGAPLLGHKGVKALITSHVCRRASGRRVVGGSEGV